MEMECLFSEPFDRVTVTESRLPARLGAYACARGSELHFLPGGFRPDTPLGKLVLAHELTHVVQQRRGALPGPGDLAAVRALEQEAAAASFQAVRGNTAAVERPRSTRCRVPPPAWQCIKEQFAGIPGIRLLQILDAAIHSAVEEMRDRIPKQNDATYSMNQGWKWLAAAGRLAVTASQWSYYNSWVPCDLIVGPDSEATRVRVNGALDTPFSERLEFPGIVGKQDLNYGEVAQKIQTLGMNEHQQAEGILYRLKGMTHIPTTPGKDFLHALTALLFGVEAGRNAATLGTSLMLLDLVRQQKRYGRGGAKPFTLSGGFHSSHNYLWDDPEAHWYGGKHPMAVHGTGSFNIRDRYEAVRGNVAVIREIETESQRHAVPRREVTLLVHWLESNVKEGQWVNEQTVRNWIDARLRVAFAGASSPVWELPGSPQNQTGNHATVTWQGAPVMAKHKYTERWTRSYHAGVECKLLPHHPDFSVWKVAEPPAELERKYGFVKCQYCKDKFPGTM